MVETGKVDLVLLWDKSENLAILNSLSYCGEFIGSIMHANLPQKQLGRDKKKLYLISHIHTHI